MLRADEIAAEDVDDADDAFALTASSLLSVVDICELRMESVCFKTEICCSTPLMSRVEAAIMSLRLAI